MKNSEKKWLIISLTFLIVAILLEILHFIVFKHSSITLGFLTFGAVVGTIQSGYCFIVESASTDNIRIGD